MFPRQIRILLLAVTLGAFTFAGSSTADAATVIAASVQDQINQQLRDYPGGTQISPYEVAYRGGAVIMVFPEPATGRVPVTASARPEIRAGASNGVTVTLFDTVHGCPLAMFNRWYCVFQDANYGGRMLQFRDCTTAGYVNDLSDYGFQNETTSWVQTDIFPGKTVAVYDQYHSQPLWNEVSHGGTYNQSPNVGPLLNDRAWRLKCTLT